MRRPAPNGETQVSTYEHYQAAKRHGDAPADAPVRENAPQALGSPGAQGGPQYLDWTLTSGGRVFHYRSDDLSEIDIVDIATALGNMCRFAGHVRKFYSVAEHSVLVSFLVPPALALQGLLHDAHEAYATDIPTPLKRLLPQYRELEDLIAARVRRKYGVPVDLSPKIKDADWVALHLEREELLPPHAEWTTPDDLILPDRRVECYPPHIARTLFLQRFYDLTKTIDGAFTAR